MDRFLAAVLAAYGFMLSRTASANIRQLQREAEAGKREARQHFTQTRYARVLGVRNSDLGLLFYALLGLSALSGLIRRRPVLTSLRLASGASLLMSLYLLWALFFRLRVWCSICMRGHAVNLSVFLLLLRVRSSG